jgi:hypothetical protein
VQVGGGDAGGVQRADDVGQRDAGGDGRHDARRVVVDGGLVAGEAAERGRGGRQLLVPAHGDLEALAADARLQLGRRPLGGDPAVVEHDDVVGQAVGLLQVLRGEQQRRAVADEVAEQAPQLDAAAGVQARRRLVEEEHGRRRDEARGEVEAAAHAAGERLDEAIGGVGQAETLEELGGAGAHDRPRQVVEPADHLEVRAGGEQAVDGGLLAGEADLRPHGGRVGDDVVPGHQGAALGGLQERGEDPHRGRLAGAVVAEQAEDRALRHVEVDVAQRPKIVVAPAEPFGEDAGLVGGCHVAPHSYGVRLIVRRTVVVHCTKCQGRNETIAAQSAGAGTTRTSSIPSGRAPSRAGGVLPTRARTSRTQRSPSPTPRGSTPCRCAASPASWGSEP